MDEKAKILNSLKYMFDVAEKEGLWFYCSYQDMWFSPKELKEEHANGKFIWGETNWMLRDPFEKLKQLENVRINMDKTICEFKKRM